MPGIAPAAAAVAVAAVVAAAAGAAAGAPMPALVVGQGRGDPLVEAAPPPASGCGRVAVAVDVAEGTSCLLLGLREGGVRLAKARGWCLEGATTIKTI